MGGPTAPSWGPPRPFVPPEGATWTGELLRQAREARGLSVAQMAERTKLSRLHIEAVEADNFGQLPVAAYLRGIVMCIARELRLDGQKVARSYLERAAGAARPGR
jgi:cytoskeletal protein RodZ